MNRRTFMSLLPLLSFGLMKNKENYIIDEFGDKLYKNSKGELHRENGPAIERSNGTKVWYKEGKIHREDCPAIEYVNHYKAWYKNGKYHREDGPAIEYVNHYKAWYKNGKYHRLDGPAIDNSSKFHRKL